MFPLELRQRPPHLRVMHQSDFGEARDIAKGQIMEWLAPPNVKWAAHPMWYGDREAEPQVADFLDCYATALSVGIGEGGDSAKPDTLLDAAKACREHLFLDPDTGLGERTEENHLTHVSYEQFIKVVLAPPRLDRLTLLYDQGYSRGQSEQDFILAAQRKVNRLHHMNKGVYAAGYLAEPTLKLCFIWASASPDVVRKATRRMQDRSRFPNWRFLDDGCGHIGK